MIASLITISAEKLTDFSKLLEYYLKVQKNQPDNKNSEATEILDILNLLKPISVIINQQC